MLNRTFTGALAALLTAWGTTFIAHAADPAPAQAPEPTPAEVREQLLKMSPEEREAKIKEYREKARQDRERSRTDTEKRRAEWEKFREELRRLPPEERDARIKAWREKEGIMPPLGGSNAVDREQSRRKYMQERLQPMIEQLRKKKAEGTITTNEQQQLQRMEEIHQRFEKGGSRSGARPAQPEKAPEAKPDKPAEPKPAEAK